MSDQSPFGRKITPWLVISRVFAVVLSRMSFRIRNKVSSTPSVSPWGLPQKLPQLTNPMTLAIKKGRAPRSGHAFCNCCMVTEYKPQAQRQGPLRARRLKQVQVPVVMELLEQITTPLSLLPWHPPCRDQVLWGHQTSEPAERRKGTAQIPSQHSPRSLRYSPHHPFGCGRHHLQHSHSEAFQRTGS